MGNSNLVDYVRISPNSTNPRNHKIDTITIHHMAGNLSVESCGEGFAESSRGASSNYGVDTNGRVGLYVEEKNRSWCSSSRANDHRAITIEVANDSRGPDWHISDAALAKTIDLCVDICRRNGIKKLNFTGDASGNLTMHNYFANTLCPGPYLESKFPYIADEVNKRLGIEPDSPIYPEPEEIVFVDFKPTVLQWQKAAIADGFDFPEYGADGIWGAECASVATRAIVRQRDTYTYKSLTRIVQKVVGVTVDGLCGPDTDAAIKAYQHKHGLEEDGEVGINTWRCMLGLG